MGDLACKKEHPLGWKCAGNYYLGLASGAIGISKCADSFGWMMLMIFTTLICVMSFVLHLYESANSKNRWLNSLNLYGWIPVCVATVAYLMKYQGFYNNPFFILLVSLAGVIAPVWWLSKGDRVTKIYSVYLLCLIALWTLIHFIPVNINAVVVTRCYYALIAVAFIWMLMIAPKVFAKYAEVNAAPFLLFWFGIIVIDFILFQLMPYISDGVPLFTQMQWLK